MFGRISGLPHSLMCWFSISPLPPLYGAFFFTFYITIVFGVFASSQFSRSPFSVCFLREDRSNSYFRRKPIFQNLAKADLLDRGPRAFPLATFSEVEQAAFYLLQTVFLGPPFLGRMCIFRDPQSAHSNNPPNRTIPHPPTAICGQGRPPIPTRGDLCFSPPLPPSPLPCIVAHGTPFPKTRGISRKLFPPTGQGAVLFVTLIGARLPQAGFFFLRNCLLDLRWVEPVL